MAASSVQGDAFLFETLLRQFFEGPGHFNVWHWGEDPVRAVEFMHRVWSQPEVLMARFSTDQIGQGLCHLAGSSEYAFALYEQRVPLGERVRAIESIESLNRNCFALICEPACGHLNQAGSNLANGVCYMFWDAIQVHPNSRSDWVEDRIARRAEYEAIEDASLNVMERNLEIPHIAVQEGALHGLGHWQMYYPERVTPVIDRFLRRDDLDPAIREYAGWARTGYVQ